MSTWSPTHIQFTVLRARNLISKGKGGNNDVFVTIVLGKEKYQTSTIKNANHPEWFEECDLPIPSMHCDIEVSLFHRGVLSDDFLGFAAIPIQNYSIADCTKSRWVSLQNKPTSKAQPPKNRGELEIKLTFHCQSTGSEEGGKKKSSSIKNLAHAFGDKFKFARSKSFRDNHTRDKAPFRQHDGNGLPKGSGEQLSRTYSMSTSYIKAMSVDRAKVNGVNDADHAFPLHGNRMPAHAREPVTGPSPAHSQSMHNLPGNRHSCAELPVRRQQAALLNYDNASSGSKDDATAHQQQQQTRSFPPGHRRAISEYHINTATKVAATSSPHPPNSPPGHVDPNSSRREQQGSGIYESIKERTEPENNGNSSSSDLESVPHPKPRFKRFPKGEPPLAPSSAERDRTGNGMNSSPQVSAMRNIFLSQGNNTRDSGILDDRSSSQANSYDGSIVNQDGVGSASAHQATIPRHEKPSAEAHAQSIESGNGKAGAISATSSLPHVFRSRDLPATSSGREKKRINVPSSQLYSKENDHGELIVRKRSRGQRDRLRQMRLDATDKKGEKGGRRFTVQGLENYQPGLYDDSQSDRSDSSKTEVPEDLLSVFKNMTKEELLRVVIKTKAQMIRKDQYIKDLENYIDDLLVRVMETTPRLLNRPPDRLHHRHHHHPGQHQQRFL